jgi:repressor of nif and glnA expression
MAFEDQNEVCQKDNQHEGTDSYHYYLHIEIQLMKIIADSALGEKEIITSIDELISALNTFDPFILRRQILTLEGKGLVKKSECGFILTEKGKKRLQRLLYTK